VIKDGNVIDAPTFADIMGLQPASGSWQVFTADEIGFIARHMGQPFPIDAPPVDPHGLLAAMTPFITASWNVISAAAVRLAMQGPLAAFFPGLTYDVGTNLFKPTTEAQLAPMYAAIFDAAPGDAAGDLIIRINGTNDVITATNDQAGQWWGISSKVGQITFADGTSVALNRDWNHPYTFTWLGAAGNTTLTGGGPFGNNLFILGPNDVANGAPGGWGNTYVFARGDGAVTIHPGTADTIQMAAGIAASDLIYQSDAAGDLIIRVIGTSDVITVTNDQAGQWWGISSNVGQITFADGTSVALNRDWNHPFTFTWLGTAGNTTLTGASLANNLYWLGPNDVCTALSAGATPTSSPRATVR